MKAWCEQCGKYVDYTQEVSCNEEMEIEGTKFHVCQIMGICPICGEKVLSNALTDSNIQRAHNAYRRALGSITTEEIRAILDKYNIGAQPLSLLLGWGANTIERQMKHTIPSKEHARRLKQLLEPKNMLDLLKEHGDRISSSAYKKAYTAVMEYLPVPGYDILAPFSYLCQSYAEQMRGVFNGLAITLTCKNGKGEATYTQASKSSKPNFQLIFGGNS